jgi:hypothetical protein
MKNKLFFLTILLSLELEAQNYNDTASFFNVNHSLNSSDLFGNGVSFFDFDKDGFDDLTLLRENDSLHFYKNNQGYFELQPSYLYNAGTTKQLLWVDFNNDGFNDMVVSTFDGMLLLYSNDGAFNFTLSNLSAGIPMYVSPNFGVSFADYDKNGFLDLFICRYTFTTDPTVEAELNRLYMNNGNGTFTDMTQQAGLNDGLQLSFQAVWLDYNNDTWPDLYIINDHSDGIKFNNLFSNNGDGTFSDLSNFSQTPDSGNSPMTNTVGDFDNDGDLDIFMTNTGGLTPGRLLLNNSDSTFSECAQLYGVDIDKFSWGASWLDADNDGHQDLYVCTSEILPEVRNYFYMNTGNNWFNDSPQLFSGNHIATSFAVACGDYNHDGYADMIVQNANGYNSFLWSNSGDGGNRFINVTVHGTVSNKMAIGTWIKVYANGEQYSHYTFCGENMMSQNSQHNIFGIGGASIVDSVIVTYVSGITDKYYNLDVNEFYNFYECESIMNSITYSSPLNFCSGDSLVLDAGNYTSYLWSTGSQMPNITVTQSGTYWVDVTDSLGASIPSDTLIIAVGNPPQISMNVTDLTCAGSNDGVIVLDIIGNASNYSVLWNGSLNGDSISNLNEGTYIYSYFDNYGCAVVDSIAVNSPFPFNVQSLILPYTATTFGSIQSIINGGTPPYSIYLDSVLASTFIDSLLPGNYSYEIYDAHGCYYYENIEIIDQTLVSLGASFIQTISFENPMTGESLRINYNGKIVEILVYNSLGQLIKSSFDGSNLQLQENLNGVFYMRIISTAGTQHFKVLKQ